jgi:hypothetical protein
MFLFLMNSIVHVVDVHPSPSTSVDSVDIEHFNSIVHVVDVHPPPTNSLETVDSEHCNSFSRPDDESLLVPCNDDLAREKVSSKFSDKALRTREYSEISKRLRSFSGYEKLEKLDKTPPHKFWAHGRSARLEVNQIPITSSPQNSPSQHTSSLNSSFRKSPVGSFTNRVAHFLRKRTSDGNEVSQSPTPNISERSGGQDCTVPSPNQSASISCFGSKERTGAEEGFQIRQSAGLGTTDSVVAGSSGLGNESNPDRLNGVDGINARSGRAQREEESPEEIIRACSDPSEDRLTVATLSGDLARAGKTSSDVSSRAGSESSRVSRLRAKRRKGIFRFLTKKRTARTRRGRGLSQPCKGGWKHLFLLNRKSSKLPKHISRKYSNDRDLFNGSQQDNSSSASPFRDSQIKQQIKPSSSSKKPESSSGTARKHSLEEARKTLQQVLALHRT